MRAPDYYYYHYYYNDNNYYYYHYRYDELSKWSFPEKLHPD